MWIGAQEDESVRALHRAIELGVNFIDTARGYGESERIVGQVVREHRGDPLYVATKVPPKNRIWPAPDGEDPGRDVPRRAHQGEPGEEPARFRPGGIRRAPVPRLER